MGRFPQLSAIIAVVVTLSTSSVVKSPNDGTFELLILHNNDMHARFEQTSQLSGACTTADREAGKCYGGFPRVATVVKEARAAAASGQGPPVLYLNAGDTYTGTAWFTIYKWKVAAEFLNALQPDAVCLGNHELDEGVDGLLPFIRNLTAPVLAANLILKDVPVLQDEPNFYNSVVLLKGKKKIGVIGYLTPETKYLAPKNAVEYEDEVISLRREVFKLKSKGVDIIIALGHSGFLKDLEIAREVDEVDLVIGGHSNTFLWNGNTTEVPEILQGPYPTVVIQPSGRKVPVVQAYAYTKYMGKLHLIFDDKGELLKYDGNPILLNHNIPNDPEVLKMVDKYRIKIDRINNEVVGSSTVFLDGEQCRLRECNLGNFINDAILVYTKENLSEEYSDVKIAVTQGGRIRSSISRPNKPFEMTRGDWMTVIPFTDTLMVVTMNGSILMETLEHSVASWRTIDAPGQFLQFSGMQVTFDLSKPPGSRVVKALAVCANCTELTEITSEYEYKLIMCGFLANNGDGYTMFEGLPKDVLQYDEITCVLDYLSKYSPVSPVEDNRIVLLNEDKVEIIPDSIKASTNINANMLLPPSNNSNSLSTQYFALITLFYLICFS